MLRFFEKSRFRPIPKTRGENLLLLMGRWAAWLVRGYQLLISPLKQGLLGPQAACRFHPSCSQYALVSLRRFGLGLGAWLVVKRILKCHPFHDGGFDPVPGGDSEDTRAKTEDRSKPSLF